MKTFLVILFTAVLGISSFGQDYTGRDYQSAQDKLNDEYTSGLFNTTHGVILDVANDASARTYFNILDWLQGRVAGLQVYKNRFGTSIPVIRGGVPGVFIDEMQVSPASLNTVSVHDIAVIKVIKTPFFGGFNSGNGAIAIYTKGDEEDVEEIESR